MKKLALIVSTVMLIGTMSTSRADRVPYLGGEPYNGSYWNGPQADYPYRAAFRSTARGSEAYAQGTCKIVRARHVSAGGKIYYRTRRVCF